jgi:hypothetical protein
MIEPTSINQLPIFDFRAVPLNSASREQLARIYESVRDGAERHLPGLPYEIYSLPTVLIQ